MEFRQAVETFKQVMNGFEGAWCVAGGWALDFYLNQQTRTHEDLEIIVLREDYQAIYQHFKNRNPQYIIKEADKEPEFFPWKGGPFPEETIQLRIDPVSGVEFDLLLTPSENGMWICRRDESIRLPLGDVAVMTKSGLPALAPEIVLFFKAKGYREKDIKDFEKFYPVLTPQQKSWFQYGLKKTIPGHKWLVD
jgi:hypothetical protein